jgi:hypothetical protein
MIKTTWGNSLTQVGFLWENEGQDRREYHQWDIAALKSSLRSSSRERGGGEKGSGGEGRCEWGEESGSRSVAGVTGEKKKWNGE